MCVLPSLAALPVHPSPTVPRGPDPPPAAPSPGTHRAPRLAWLLERQSGVAAAAHIALWWMKAHGQRSAGAAVPSVDARLPRCTSEDKRPRALHYGLAGGGALQDVRMGPGGGCSRAVKPQLGWRVCVPRPPSSGPAANGKGMWSDQRLWHGKHPEHHQGPWIPALPHADQPGVPLPPRQAHGKVGRGEECPVRAMWAGQQEGPEPQQDLPMGTTAGAAPAGEGGSTHIVGAAAPGQGFYQSPGVAGIPRASPACGRLGADGLHPALGQREDCRAFGSSGIFKPAASVLPPGPSEPGPGKLLTRGRAE